VSAIRRTVGNSDGSTNTRIREDPDAGTDRLGRYRAGGGGLDDDPVLDEVELAPCCVRTLSIKVMAAST
jgi:hypothetical protein